MGSPSVVVRPTTRSPTASWQLPTGHTWRPQLPRHDGGAASRQEPRLQTQSSSPSWSPTVADGQGSPEAQQQREGLRETQEGRRRWPKTLFLLYRYINRCQSARRQLDFYRALLSDESATIQLRTRALCVVVAPEHASTPVHIDMGSPCFGRCDCLCMETPKVQKSLPEQSGGDFAVVARHLTGSVWVAATLVSRMGDQRLGSRWLN